MHVSVIECPNWYSSGMARASGTGRDRFTGWVDADLSEKGMAEAKIAGVLLKACGYTFDIAYTSVLKRAIRTLWIALDEMDLMWLPVVKSWRLNERCYGVPPGKK